MQLSHEEKVVLRLAASLAILRTTSDAIISLMVVAEGGIASGNNPESLFCAARRTGTNLLEVQQYEERVRKGENSYCSRALNECNKARTSSRNWKSGGVMAILVTVKHSMQLRLSDPWRPSYPGGWSTARPYPSMLGKVGSVGPAPC